MSGDSHKLLLDDFVASSTRPFAENTHMCIHMLFGLLGWRYDQLGPKADEFSDSVCALGVRSDLSQASVGVVTVDNTDKCRSGLESNVCYIIARGVLPVKDGLSLRGRLAFA